ncbi:MAG: ethanolamine ammonia-lyase reactivating factor EutA [Symbiobacteriia bacterium]
MTEQGEALTSVGVDVGTATTKIVFSRLHFRDLGLGLGVPRVRLTGREILYRSQVRETPVEGNRLLPDRLLAFLHQAMAEAGIAPGTVESGGVIITGEAARKENARALLDLLSREAGDFVVATAGPHLEAVIAGKGSGAAARSEQVGGAVAGVDIGGGTVNIAVFRNGQAVDTACLNLGGKSLRLDPGTGQVLSVTPAARAVLEAQGVAHHAGEALDLTGLLRTGEALAEVIAGALLREPLPVPATGLYDGPPLRGGYRLSEVLVSGGVAAELYNPAERGRETALRHGDIGPALAWALRRSIESRGLRLGVPRETTFATVIGVGVHTLNLSGSTIRVGSEELLPLTNVPVIKPFPGGIPPGLDGGDWAAEIAVRHSWLDVDGPLAVAVGRLPEASYDAISQVAAGIRLGMAVHLDQGRPLVVVAEQDIASSLGLLLGAGPQVITVDLLSVEDGNYIDVGKPLYGGTTVPVVIKTLVFSG